MVNKALKIEMLIHPVMNFLKLEHVNLYKIMMIREGNSLYNIPDNHFHWMYSKTELFVFWNREP